MSAGGNQHVTVLLEEAVAALHVNPEGRYIDATFGRGGHSRAILSQLGAEGRLLSLDRDPQAVAAAGLDLGELVAGLVKQAIEG